MTSAQSINPRIGIIYCSLDSTKLKQPDFKEVKALFFFLNEILDNDFVINIELG